MAHLAQQEFFRSVKAVFPEYFKNSEVLDVGSLDINGSNLYLFDNCDYLGVDIAPGKNVDVVSPVHLAGFPSEYFDTVVSGECLEHCEPFTETIQTIVRILKPSGLFAMTCAGINRPEHGTTRTDTESSPFTTDFYQNRTAEDFLQVPGFDQMKGHFVEARGGQDLYYCGIRQ